MALLLFLGCHPVCGDYTVATNVWYDHTMGDLYEGDPTGTEFDAEGHEFYALDGDYDEQCGKKFGTWGNWNLNGDNRAIVWFRPGDPDFERDINGLAFNFWVSFPITSPTAGTTFEVGELLGEANLIDMSGSPFKLAPVSEGSTLTITSGELSDDVCTEDEGWAQGVGPAFDLSWDITWADPSQEITYTASGSDTVWFDTFLSQSCASIY